MARKRQLRHKYSIEIEEFEQMRKDQNDLCAICNKPQTPSIVHSKLVVDHCHQTKKVRGLLCNKCNQGLGLFKDNINSLKSAVEYLEKHSAIH